MPGPCWCGSKPDDSPARRWQRAFTLIEIMVVVAIMGMILAMGIPSIYKVVKKEGMRKAVSDIQEACTRARARAILSGSTAELVFHPLDRRFEVSGGKATPAPPTASSGSAGQLPEGISIEMLDINLLEYKQSDSARVRFFPNGTCDEMTLVLHSDKNEWRKLSLEVTTGVLSWGPVQ